MNAKEVAKLNSGDYLIIALCDRFESDWKASNPSRIEDVLESVPGEGSSRAQLLVQLIRVDRHYRRLRGDSPSLSEYILRFPFAAEAIEQSLAATWESSVAISGQVLNTTIAHGIEFQKPPLDMPADEYSHAKPSAKVIGRYQLDCRLGRGGFGEVWKALDLELHRHVAIKFVRSDRLNTPQTVEAFLDEGRKLAKLQHPAIMAVYDVGRDEGQCFLVTELASQGTLADRIERMQSQGARLSLEDSVEIVATVAEGLHHAHLKGLVHRDVKPQNILMSDNGQPKLADFGLATTEREQLGERASTVGTFAYMSPEQIRGESHLVDPRADIYSLGAVLYELLTGRRVFLAESASQFREQILYREVRPPRTIVDTIPQTVERIVLKCLSKQLRDRYTTAMDLAADLRGAIEDRTLESTASTPPTFLPSLNPLEGPRHGKFSGKVVLATIMSVSLVTAFLAIQPFRSTSVSPPNPDSITPAEIQSPKIDSPSDARSDSDQAPRIDPGNGWKRLLISNAPPPVLLTENPIKGDSRINFTPLEGAADIRADFTSLVQFGETDSDEFRLRMTVSQSRLGAFGVFVGCRADAEFPERMRLTQIHFSAPDLDRSSTPKRRIVRISLVNVLMKRTGLENDWGESRIGEVEAFEGSQRIVEIVVAKGQVRRIQYNFQTFEIDPEKIDHVKLETKGRFGVYLSRESAVFRDVYLKE